MAKKKDGGRGLRISFPDTLYVQMERDGDDVRASANQDVAAFVVIGETQKVGVYELVGVRQISAEVKMVSEK